MAEVGRVDDFDKTVCGVGLDRAASEAGIRHIGKIDSNVFHVICPGIPIRLESQRGDAALQAREVCGVDDCLGVAVGAVVGSDWKHRGGCQPRSRAAIVAGNSIATGLGGEDSALPSTCVGLRHRPGIGAADAAHMHLATRKAGKSCDGIIVGRGGVESARPQCEAHGSVFHLVKRGSVAIPSKGEHRVGQGHRGIEPQMTNPAGVRHATDLKRETIGNGIAGDTVEHKCQRATVRDNRAEVPRRTIRPTGPKHRTRGADTIVNGECGEITDIGSTTDADKVAGTIGKNNQRRVLVRKTPIEASVVIERH